MKRQKCSKYFGSVAMSGLTDGAVVSEFREFDIKVKLGSSVLDRREFQAFNYLGIIWKKFNSLSLSPFSPRNWSSIPP